MNPGRFWFSLPSPYVTHDPTLGRVKRIEPVFIMRVAAAWSGMSVYIERIVAISSTCWLSVGNISLVSIPLLPVLENVKGDANDVPLLSPGMVLSSYLSNAGFGSHVS